ncbi:MAG: HEPN domain-containing protein [Tannerellaceae bacterium]|jgi:HEPN domain-containing protein|nr:HEPN domain-containing protein [Tannerellaceae bacterium]
MNNENVQEWLQLADDDIYSAKILNNALRKPYEIICYHCAQAVEKYLKGYLTWQDIVPPKTHDLIFLNSLCIEQDNEFRNIKAECNFLNRYSNDIRYPHKYEVNENDVTFSISAVEKIKYIKPILDIRNCMNYSNNNEDDEQ